MSLSTMTADLVLLGAPGSGKGTQAAILTEKYGIPHIATGDIFRAQAAQDTALGRQFKSFLDRGELVPDALAIDVIRDRLSHTDVENGFVLDGFPRTVLQAQALDRLLSGLRRPLDAVLYLEVARPELLERLGQRAALEQRSDDDPRVAAHRIDVYLQSTAPLIDYYRRRGKLQVIDGGQPPGAVAEQIERVIGGLQTGAV